MSFVPLNAEQIKQVKAVYYGDSNYFGRDRLKEAIQNRFPDFDGSERAVLGWLKTQKTHQFQDRGVRKTETKPFRLTKRGFLCLDTIDLSNTPWKTMKAALVCTDAYTRYLSVKAIPDKTSASTAKAFEEMLAERPHAEVSCIVVDNGNEFTTGAFQALVKRKGIRFLTSAPHSPWSNGISERSVGTIMRLVFAERFATGNKNWVKMLKPLCDNYNNTSHASTKKTPLELENEPQDSSIHEEAINYQAGKTAKRYKDKSVGADIPVGSIVLAKKIDVKAGYKFNRSGYFDPEKRYEVVARKENGYNRLPSYKLRRLKDNVTVPHNFARWQILPIEAPKWSVERKGKHVVDEGDPEDVALNAPDADEDPEVPAPRRSLRGTNTYVVSEILDRRGRGHALEYLVRWEGYKLSESSWEPKKNLKGAMDLVKDFEEGR